MKVFFTTTPRLRKDYPNTIDEIYGAIESLGHKLTSNYIKRVDIEEFYSLNNEKQPIYYDEILDSLKSADVVVFETSMHSIGVGMLLKEALDQGKGVIALHMKGKYPFY